MSVFVSLGVVGAVVLLCELIRQVGSRVFSGEVYWVYLLEVSCTLQLCWCAHELKLLGESSDLSLTLRMTLLYLITTVHLTTFRGASCSFLPPLESLCRGQMSSGRVLGMVGCQMGGAVLAQTLAVLVWSQGWSDIHVRHGRFGYRCFDPLGGSVLEAAGVELLCSFVVQTVVLQLHRLIQPLRVATLSAVITALVYAGGAISGAVFNPVLAVSLQFPCSGHSYLEYMFVYWLGPLLGVVSCNLLFQTILPFLCGRSSLDSEHKQKTQ